MQMWLLILAYAALLFMKLVLWTLKGYDKVSTKAAIAVILVLIFLFRRIQY